VLSVLAVEPPIDPSLPCSQQSLAIGEPIAGSATPDISAWLVLEHPQRWGRDALTDSGFSDGLQSHLGELVRKLRMRFLLIRRFGSEDREGGTRRAYLVQPKTQGRAKPKIWQFELDEPDDLLELDVESMLLAGMPGGERTPPEHLYLVCAHGKRDRCCALRGVALAKTMSEVEELDGEIWQCSHLGGHRFAATMVYLPHGVHYGRLQPDDVPDLVAAHRRGDIYDLRNYRGQTRFPAAVQAAEAWLREQESDMSLDGPELLEHSLRGQRWSARFRSHDGKLHKVVVEPRMGNLPRLKSCDAEAPEPAQWFYAVRHEAHSVV